MCKIFSLSLVLLGMVMSIFLSCGDDIDDLEKTLTINQAHTEFLSVLIIADTLGGANGTLNGLPHANIPNLPCDGGGSAVITIIDDTTDTMTFNDCITDAAAPDSINGSVTRIMRDSDRNGLAENVLITATTDLTQDADWDNDGVIESQIIWSIDTTLEIKGFRNRDIVDANGSSKSDIIVNGSAAATLLGNNSTMTFKDHDIFFNLQDPGDGFIMELALEGTVEYSDSCITSTMVLFTTSSFKLPSGSSMFSTGTISLNNIHGVLAVRKADDWSITVDDGTSVNYTQAEFDQLPATCP